MAAPEVQSFLNYLAVERQVSASTQTIALNAIVFLYEAVLEKPLGHMQGLKRVQRRQRLPVVLTVDEVKATFQAMNGTCLLMAQLIYGAGLRVNECLGMRVKDVDFSAKTLNVRDGKGGKQTDLFGYSAKSGKKDQLMTTMDRINKKFSRGTLKLASEGIEKAWVMRRSYKSPNYTGDWMQLPKVR